MSEAAPVRDPTEELGNARSCGFAKATVWPLRLEAHDNHEGCSLAPHWRKNSQRSRPLLASGARADNPRKRTWGPGSIQTRPNSGRHSGADRDGRIE